MLVAIGMTQEVYMYFNFGGMAGPVLVGTVPEQVNTAYLPPCSEVKVHE